MRPILLAHLVTAASIAVLALYRLWWFIHDDLRRRDAFGLDRRCCQDRRQRVAEVEVDNRRTADRRNQPSAAQSWLDRIAVSRSLPPGQ